MADFRNHPLQNWLERNLDTPVVEEVDVVIIGEAHIPGFHPLIAGNGGVKGDLTVGICGSPGGRVGAALEGRFAGGMVEVRFNVQDNRICDLNFSGDFFGAEPTSLLAEKLNGSIPRFDEIAGKLAVIDTAEYINSVTKEELLSLFRLI